MQYILAVSLDDSIDLTKKNVPAKTLDPTEKPVSRGLSYF